MIEFDIRTNKPQIVFISLFALLLQSVCLSGCPRTGKHEVGNDGETHFLRNCTSECDEGLSCVCGVCTRICENDEDCFQLSTNAVCVEDQQFCDSGPSSSSGLSDRLVCNVLCARDENCEKLGDSYVCQEGSCREADQSSTDSRKEEKDVTFDASMDTGILAKPIVSEPDAQARFDAETEFDAEAGSSSDVGADVISQNNGDDGGEDEAQCPNGECWTCEDMINPDFAECKYALASSTGFSICQGVDNRFDRYRYCMCDLCQNECVADDECVAYMWAAPEPSFCLSCLREQESQGACAAELSYCQGEDLCEGNVNTEPPSARTCSFYAGSSSDVECRLHYDSCSDGKEFAIECHRPSASSDTIDCYCLADDKECIWSFTLDFDSGLECLEWRHLFEAECSITRR